MKGYIVFHNFICQTRVILNEAFLYFCNISVIVQDNIKAMYLSIQYLIL